MPAILSFPTSGLFQLYITDCDGCGYDEVVGDDIVIRFLKPEQLLEEAKDMSEYDQTKYSWMMEEPDAKKLVRIKATYKAKAAHTIGGKPNFTQSPEYTDYINFLQFDSEDGIIISLAD